MRKGFTLLELLIVVVILGVLALIAAPTLLNAADQAKEGAVKANVSAAASSITSQFALHSDKTSALVASDVADALNSNNKNPFTNAANPFAIAANSGAGTVSLVAGVDANGTDIITINGYKKDGTSIITKVVSAPADN